MSSPYKDKDAKIKALEEAAKYTLRVLVTAKRRFPKSVRNSDTFSLLNAEACLSKALHDINSESTTQEDAK